MFFWAQKTKQASYFFLLFMHVLRDFKDERNFPGKSTETNAFNYGIGISEG